MIRLFSWAIKKSPIARGSFTSGVDVNVLTETAAQRDHYTV